MSISRDTFERYRQKGLDARRAGQWDSARIYLLEAARAMVALSKEAKGEELQNARRETAQRLPALARNGEKAKPENRPQPAPGAASRESQGENEPATSASQWLVK